MGDYGLRVSKQNYDVNTCDDIDCVYSSSDFAIKVLAAGSSSVNTTATVAHGLTYTPGALAFYSLTDAEGNTGMYQQCPGGSVWTNTCDMWIDSTNLNFSSLAATTAYYSIFVDPSEIATGSGAASKDYGIRISKEGKNVLTASDTDLSLTSKYRTFKEYLHSTVNVYLVATTIAGGGLAAGATTVNVVDSTGLPTSGVIVVQDNAPVTTPEAIKYTGITGNALTGCTRGYWGTGDVAHNAGRFANNGIGKQVIPHNLGYAPISSVLYKEGSNVTSTPAFAFSLMDGVYCYANVDANNLYIIVENNYPIYNFSVRTGTLSFSYYIFYDSIT